MTVVSIHKATGGFNDHQVAELAKRGISIEQAQAHGVIGAQIDSDLPGDAPDYWTAEGGYLPGLVFPWTSAATGETTWQIKPDNPLPDPEKPGKYKKYLFETGWKPVLHPVRIVPGSDKVLLVEGTHQRIVAGLYAPAGWSVYGIAGCRGWSSEGLPVNDLEEACDGATVTVIFDADMSGNMNVYEAGQALASELDLAGAASVRFALVNGSKNTGIDDLIGGKPKIESRHNYMARLIEPSRCPEPAKVKKPSRDAIRAAERAKKEESRRVAAEIDQRRADTENRPMVDVTGDRFLVTSEIIAALKARWDGVNLFSRGTPAGLYQRNEDQLTLLTRDTLRTLISISMRTGRASALTGAWEDSWPDDGVLGSVLSRARLFKPIEVVTSSPFVRTDGSVCASNGYDAESKVYVRMNADLEVALDVPDVPDAEAVQAAVKLLLDDWLGDFPFPTDADRAGALALILTPFVRQFMDVVPIAVIDGNGPSAGKGLLIDLIARLVLGRPAILKALPSDNEEMRKAITSALLAGRPLMVWDEAHVLEGTALAQLLTVPTWSDRRLGQTADVEIDNRVTFAALGNNVRVEGDVGRRAYRIRIHPTMERPEDRDVSDFRHPDIKGWTDEHRAELLSAVLTLVRAWHCAGRPAGRGDFGSFEKWSRTVGGILTNAGVVGFLDGRKEWLAGANTSSDAWAAHLAWLDHTFSGRAFKSSEAATELARAGLDAPLPSYSRALASPEASAAYAQSLGMVYGHRVDQTFYGLTLRREGVTDGASRWTVWSARSEASLDNVVFAPNRDTVKTDKSEAGMLGMGENGQNGREVESGPLASPLEENRRSERIPETNKGSKGSRGVVPPSSRVSGASAEKNVRAHIEGGQVTPRSTPLTPFAVELSYFDVEESDNPSAIVTFLRDNATSYASQCSKGHPEVLVDGLWFACGTCHPATVASNHRTPNWS